MNKKHKAIRLRDATPYNLVVDCMAMGVLHIIVAIGLLLLDKLTVHI